MAEWRIMSFNTENFFASTGQILRGKRGFFKQDPLKPESPKPLWAVEGIARAILAENPDIVTVVEVEKNIETLRRFSEAHLGGAYEAFMLPGNDPRGINIGFLVKRDLPVEIVMETHVRDIWVNPDEPGLGAQRLFSRDLPVLSVYARGFTQRGPPLLTLLGTHFKSKRPVPGDPLGGRLRRAQVEGSVRIIDELHKRWGSQARIVFAGDFNGVIATEDEFQVLRGTAMRDPFDILGLPNTPDVRATQAYFPPRGRPIYSQIDYALVSSSLAALVRGAHVHRYPGLDPLPRTFRGRRKQPSDHNPVLVRISAPELLAAYEGEVGSTLQP